MINNKWLIPTLLIALSYETQALKLLKRIWLLLFSKLSYKIVCGVGLQVWILNLADLFCVLVTIILHAIYCNTIAIENLQ